MTTARGTITSALKKLKVLRSSGEPKAADAADGLASLASLYNEWISAGSFGRVYDIAIVRGGDVVAGANQHINVLTEEAVNVELPAQVPWDGWIWKAARDYGWGLHIPFGADPNVSVPPDKCVVQITDQFGPGRATYIYDGYVQRWMRVDTIKLSDEAPLSARNPEGLASCLAFKMAEMFGDELLSPLTARSAAAYQAALVLGYGVPDRSCVVGDYW